MENIETTIPTPVAQETPPVQTVQAAPPPPAAETPPAKKNIMLYVIFAIAVLIVLGGVIASLMMGSAPKAPEPAVVVQPTAVVTPTPVASTDEQEVDGVVVDDPSTDFTDVDKDLQGL
ncbi:MAG: hypothetical protein AAB675_02665 [Patescibacteria group bacterium]